MRGRGWWIAVALAWLVAPALLASTAAAQVNVVVDPPIAAPSLRYDVHLENPFAESILVTIEATGLPPGPFEMRFADDSSPTGVQNASWTHGVLAAEPKEGVANVQFRVPAGERTAGFVLVHLDRALPGPANASQQGGPTEVVFHAPEGWVAVAPPGPTGLAAFGRDLATQTREVGGARVRMSAPGQVAATDWEFLAVALPHIAAQHAAPPADILILRAPGGALAEPAAASPAVALSVDASVEDLARALVRMHQGYRVVEIVPASAAWMREGQERYHTLTALVAANVTSAEEAGEMIAIARSVADPNVTLPQAGAGSVTARSKGLVVVRALDTEMRNASGGRVGLADLVIELARGSTPGSRYDSADIEEAAERVVGAPLDAFFADHVYGTEWPETVPIARAADIFLDGLRAEPDRAASGQQVVAVFDAVNRGTRAGAIELLVALDGEQVGSTRVELAIGERARIGTPVVAIVPGDHTIEVAQLRATFRVLEGPALRLDRATTTPAEPAAGEPFTLLVYVRNDGEAPALARLEVRENDLLLQRTTNATVEGGATRAITLPMRLDEAGLHALQVDLLSSAGTGFLTHEVRVQGEPADDRGAPGLSVLVVLLAGLIAWAARRRSR